MKKTFLYILVVVSLLIVGILLLTKDSGKEKAIQETKTYLAQNYPNLKYDIRNVSVPSPNEFKYYGYFKYAVTVLDTRANETFEVYYDKNMEQLEDSRKLEEKEAYLEYVVKPKLEEYVAAHFGEVKFVSASYYIESAKPIINVKFHKDGAKITQSDFQALISFVKESAGLDHAIVIVDYWMNDLTFQEEF